MREEFTNNLALGTDLSYIIKRFLIKLESKSDNAAADLSDVQF